MKGTASGLVAGAATLYGLWDRHLQGTQEVLSSSESFITPRGVWQHTAFPGKMSIVCCGISHNMQGAPAASKTLTLPCMLSSYRVYFVSDVCVRAFAQRFTSLGCWERTIGTWRCAQSRQLTA